MACGQSTFVSGTYTGQIWFPMDGDEDDYKYGIGSTDDGFEIEKEVAAQEITSDQYGDSVIDGIYRGGQCFFNLTLLEFNTDGANRLRKAYQNVANSSLGNDQVNEGRMGTIGCTLRNYAFEMTLTRVSPLNASNSPATVWIPAAILDPSFPVRWTMQSRLWSIPLRIRALPYSSDGAGPGNNAQQVLELPGGYNSKYESTIDSGVQQTIWYLPRF